MRPLRYLAVLLLVGALSAAGWFGYRSEAMKLKRVEVVGNENVTADDIVDASTLVNGAHLLRLSTGRVARRVESISWIAGARVERILPSKVRIVVSERSPAAVLLVAGTGFLIDRDGVILQEGTRPLPVISGIEVQDLAPGSKVTGPQVDHTFRVLDSLDPELAAQTKSIEAPSVDRITLVLDSGTRVLFGAAEDLEDKNYAVMSLLRKYRLENKHVERLDVRVPLRPAVKLR